MARKREWKFSVIYMQTNRDYVIKEFFTTKIVGCPSVRFSLMILSTGCRLVCRAVYILILVDVSLREWLVQLVVNKTFFCILH